MCVLSFPANRKRNLYQLIIKTTHPRALATLIDKRIRPGCIAIRHLGMRETEPSHMCQARNRSLPLASHADLGDSPWDYNFRFHQNTDWHWPSDYNNFRFQNGSLDYIPHHNLVARCWYAGPTDVQSLVWFPVNSRELRHAPQTQNTDTVTDWHWQWVTDSDRERHDDC